MATPRKRDVTLRQIAQEAGVDEALVRNVLKEASGIHASKDVQDRIFKTARKLGYDFRKLKIGKRLQYRKETLDEVFGRIRDHEGWDRARILEYLKESLALVDRVHRRVFQEEFGDEAR